MKLREKQLANPRKERRGFPQESPQSLPVGRRKVLRKLRALRRRRVVDDAEKSASPAYLSPHRSIPQNGIVWRGRHRRRADRQRRPASSAAEAVRNLYTPTTSRWHQHARGEHRTIRARGM